MKYGARIRAPTSDDWEFYLNGVREILAQQGNNFTEDDLEEERNIFARLSREKRFLVAESLGGDRLGFLLHEPGTCKPWLPKGRPTEAFAWVNVVYVGARARGQGVGRLLYDHLEAAMKQQGCLRVLCDVYEVNGVSLAFHERIGFETVAIVDKWHMRDPVCDRQCRRKLNVELAAADLLVALLEDGSEAGRLVFQVTRECPYGVSYGAYDYTFLHVDELAVHRPLVADAEARCDVACALLGALQRRAQSELEHVVMPRERGDDEAGAWAAAAGLRPAVRVLAKALQ